MILSTILLQSCSLSLIKSYARLLHSHRPLLLYPTFPLRAPSSYTRRQLSAIYPSFALNARLLLSSHPVSVILTLLYGYFCSQHHFHHCFFSSLLPSSLHHLHIIVHTAFNLVDLYLIHNTTYHHHPHSHLVLPTWPLIFATLYSVVELRK